MCCIVYYHMLPCVRSQVALCEGHMLPCVRSQVALCEVT